MISAVVGIAIGVAICIFILAVEAVVLMWWPLIRRAFPSRPLTAAKRLSDWYLTKTEEIEARYRNEGDDR